MSSLFSKVIEREIPAYILAEDEFFISFLDIMPVSMGHALVVPKIEVDYVFDLEDYYLNRMLTFAKPLAKAIEAVVPCLRMGLSVVGLEVPHAHLHLIPLNSIHDMSFTNPRLALSSEEFSALATAIKSKLL
jgi:histidine triad (HIT) family protein